MAFDVEYIMDMFYNFIIGKSSAFVCEMCLVTTHCCVIGI